MISKLFENNYKPFIYSDNGHQFISHRFKGKCKEVVAEYERMLILSPFIEYLRMNVWDVGNLKGMKKHTKLFCSLYNSITIDEFAGHYSI